MKTLIVAAAIAAGLTSMPAPAQGAGGGWMQRDQTRAEAQQRTDRLFQMLDANGDGTLTRAEADQVLAQFQAAGGDDDNGSRRGARLQRMIEQAFAGTQSLTLQQFEAQSLARFDAADINHDGTVTVAERQQAREQRSEAKQGTAPHPK